MLNLMIQWFKNKMINKLRCLKYYTKVLLNNWTVNKDSYAQHGEDILVELSLPKGVNSFIDTGANVGLFSLIPINLLRMGHEDFALNRALVLSGS